MSSDHRWEESNPVSPEGPKGSKTFSKMLLANRDKVSST